MTKQQAIEKHRKMWNWIADKTLEMRIKIKKEDYFIANHYYLSQDIPEHLCFCCEYTKDKSDYCASCPIQWNNDFCFGFLGSEFSDWLNEMDYIKAAELARKIANLPEREEN